MISKGMAAAFGVWLAGIGSASALVAVLNAPLVPRLDKVPPAAPAVTAVEPVSVERVSPVTESVLMVPTVTLTAAAAPARRAPRRAPAEVKPEVPRDISAMQCGEARELSMGSGHVQICE